MKHQTDVIKLSSYTPKSYKEKVEQKIVKYGEKNDFPEYLVSLFYGSPTHGAVCKTKAQMIYGKGFTGDNSALVKVGQLGLDDVFEKCALDLVIQGGFCVEVVWNMTREYISKVNHMEFERIRAEESDSEGKIHYFQYSEDWTDSKKSRETTRLKAYDPAMKNEEPRQLIYVRPFTAGLNHYPKPDYLGAVNYIELESSISEFLVNHMRNGMSPSTWLHFLNGEPDDDEKIKIRRNIEKQYSGAENAGSIVITYSDGVERKPHLDQVEISDAPKQWEFISDHVTDKILISHRVTTPVLFGVKEAGQLGATQELEIGAKLFEMHVISPMRRHLVAAANKIMMECGITSLLSIEANNVLAEITPKQPEPQPQQLSSHECPKFTDEQEAAWLAYLSDKGEEIDLNEWDLVSEEDVDDEMGEFQLHLSDVVRVKMFKRFADPDEKSEIDTGLYKIRYRYSQNLSDKSRLFCRNMVANSKQGVSYRFEDIQSMEGQVNTQFSPKGESSYSIWLHKGGAYCHHRWVRQVWVRKREGGRFLPNDGLNNDKRVSEAQARSAGVPFKDKDKGWGNASKRPIDTPNKGRLNLSAIVNKLLNR